jgi:hypothetical protein
MVAAAQDFGHLQAPKNSGAGVVGVFEQALMMALRLQGRGCANCAGQKANNAVDDRHGRQFAPSQNKITHRNLLVSQASDALIKTFVVAAEQNQLLVVPGPSLQIRLHQGLSLGSHQQNPPTSQDRDGLKSGKHRFGLEHHARTAPVGKIIHFAVTIRGVIPGIVGVECGNTGPKGAADHPKLPEGPKGLRQQTDNIQAHQGKAIKGQATAGG